MLDHEPEIWEGSCAGCANTISLSVYVRALHRRQSDVRNSNRISAFPGLLQFVCKQNEGGSGLERERRVSSSKRVQISGRTPRVEQDGAGVKSIGMADGAAVSAARSSNCMSESLSTPR